MGAELTFIQDSMIGRRKNRRRGVHLTATIVVDGESIDGVISDLSESGAKLALRGQERGGEKILLEVEDHRFEANIVWREAGAIGIAFDDDVPTAIVDGLAKLSRRTR